MDLKWLEDLLVLLETKSFTRSAAIRHVTQPAFSRRIRLLEDWLGVALVDRSTRPISVLTRAQALNEELGDIVHRLYALRNLAQSETDSRDRVTFVAQHTLAISRFPSLIRSIKQQIPDTAYRVNPANNNDCEAQFLKEAHFLLCYETENRGFDFSHQAVKRLCLGKDRLLPVVSPGFLARFSSIDAMLNQTIPWLMYQKGGFFANLLANTLPGLLRDYRGEVICESAFSASLKEMALADMGVAWLARGLIQSELNSGSLIPLETEFGSTELDIVIYFKDDGRSRQAAQIFSICETMLIDDN